MLRHDLSMVSDRTILRTLRSRHVILRDDGKC